MINRIIILIVFLAVTISSDAKAFSLLDWFYDKANPLVTSGFDTSKACKDKINIYFLIVDQDTAVESVGVFLDDKDVTLKVDFGVGYYKNKINIDTKKIPDGPHCLMITATDKSKSRNASTTKIYFDVDNTPPGLRFVRQKSKLYYGKTAVLIFKASEEDVDIEGSFQKKVVKCYPSGERYYQLILGSELSDTYNKDYLLHLSIKDKAGNITYRRIYVKVYASSYIVSRFELKPKKVRLLSADVVRADWERVEEVVSKERNEKFWTGRFLMPTSGRMSLPFGALEFINGIERGRHRGLDIANGKGSYIKAANNGEVVLAEYLPAHGNTVVVDHGQGIFSYYAHMQNIKVGVDQRVWKGQVLGTMGSTGVSTNSHLHFAISVHNTRVDPMQWLDTLVVN